MAKLVFAVIIAATILLTGTIATSFDFIQPAEALKAKGVKSSMYGKATKGIVCGDRLCSEIPGGAEAFREQMKQKAKVEKITPQTKPTEPVPKKITPPHKAKPYIHAEPSMKTKSSTMTSSQDPGEGHSEHQLAVILPPSDKIYKGIITYSASENIQLVALHGPLAKDDVKGQMTWTPDGDTHFALTLVDPENKMGTWMFTGNALALHTFNKDPFTVSYTVHYAKVSDSFGMRGECYCPADCTCDADGVCTCSGEPGACMCGPNCTCDADGTCLCGGGCTCDADGVCTCPGNVDGQCMCGPDGTCQCAAGCSCDADGVCTCPGNVDGQCMCGPNCTCGADGTCTCGQGMHGMQGCTCGPEGCDCPGCSCDEAGVCTCGQGMHGCQCGGHGMHGKGHHGMSAVSGTMTSTQDLGVGHKDHQLAVLLAPRSQPYTGLITYSASENIQLVALHGPLAKDDVKGQMTWTPDGDTHFALTLVDPENKMGTWMFTGNALALHTFNNEPFTTSYSIVTMDGGMDSSVMSKRGHGEYCNCAGDCSCDEKGVCTCSGEEGPCMCGPNCTCGP